MGVQMSLLVAAGGFLPWWVRALGLRADDLDKLVYSFGPEANADVESTEEEKVELVLSRVPNCSRPKAINALLSTGNDVEGAVAFLKSFLEDDSSSHDDIIVKSTSELNLEMSSSSDIDKKKEVEEILTESSCEPIAMPLPSGRVWGQPDTYSDDTPSVTTNGQSSYAASSIPFGTTSQFDSGVGSSTAPAQDDMTDLLLACRTGLLASVKSILSRGGININAERYIGFNSSVSDKRIRGDMESYYVTPLILACDAGHLLIVKEILNCEDADVNKKNGWGETALHTAARKGHLGIVRMLIQDFKAQVDAKDNDQTTLFHFAAMGGNLEIVRMVIQDFKAQVDAQDNWKRTPLHLAAQAGKLEIVRMLIQDFKAQVDAKAYYQMTPLHYAVQAGKLEIVRTLIKDFKAQEDAKDNDQRTPLHLAAQAGELETVRMLIQDFKARVDAQDGSKKTPLHLAAQAGKLEIVRMVIQDFKAQVDAKDKWKRTPLHFAAEAGKVEVVKFLVDQLKEKYPSKFLQKIHMKDKYGNRAQDIAKNHGHSEIVEFLKSVTEEASRKTVTEEASRKRCQIS